MSKICRLLFLQLFTLLSLYAFAVPGVGFLGNYGPLNGAGASIAVDANSNSYVCGTTSPYAGIFVSKISPTGAAVWTKTYATDRDSAAARSVAVDSGGNVYVGGMISNGGNLDGLVLKYDNNGNLQWQSFYDFSTGADEFNQIA